MIDGARMLSPGVVRNSISASKISNQAIISVLGLHLGPSHQRSTIKQGYSKEVEDRLLESINWQRNGYRLFEIASWGGSCPHGWFGTAAESNCIIISRRLFQELNGYDEAFSMPGGGLVNLDFYKRAIEFNGTNLVYLFGEGCFHQLHGGVTTGSKNNSYTFNELNEEYRKLRGIDFSIPNVLPLIYGQFKNELAPIIQQSMADIMNKEQLLSIEERCNQFMNGHTSNWHWNSK